MEAPGLESPRLARQASSIPPALSPMLKSLGLEEDDPEEVFEILSKEGAGAFGRVFCASYRRKPSQLVALKVIPIALEAGQRGEDIENVRREIQFLRECDHPNVVAFFGAYYKDAALWVAMEYCGGGSVGDVSRHRRLREDEIAVILRGALHGLAYLHARKKIHRDIKGGNILLTATGAVKIADFGVSAQLKDTLSRRGTFVGTPYWMSPEMIQDSDYDYKSDIWSLGITMIELADQKPPLFDEHPMRVLIQIPRNPSPSVKHPHLWTPLFTQFVQYCLQKDPTERPSAIACLAHPFIKRSEGVSVVYGKTPVVAATQESTYTAADDSDERGAKVEGDEESRNREALADDVTLKASAARPPKPLPRTPVMEPPTLDDPQQDDSISSTSESILEDVPALTTSQSFSDGDEACVDDTPPRPPSVASGPPLLPSTDHAMALRIDDAFELPPNAVINRIHAAAASTRSMRQPPPTAAGSPINRPPASRPSLRFSSSASDAPPVLHATPSPLRASRRELTATPSFHRPGDTSTGVEPLTEDTAWQNPLAELTRSSHDRVNALLSSISSSRHFTPVSKSSLSLPTSSLPLARSSSFVAVSASRGLAPLAISKEDASSSSSSSSSTSSSNHFIGSPFRVSHQLCVKFNTVDAQFHGVPPEWQAVHRQFGVALAQLRRRTNADEQSVPALPLMLHRELLQRDGLQCKYIYRVSPDQNDVLRAKQAIDHGSFDAASVRDPHVFASLIKLWLRELPTALLAALSCDDLATCSTWLVATTDKTTVTLATAFDQVHTYIQGTVLAKLPPVERSVLLWVVDHMLEVVDKSSRNGMQEHSLAVVMTPNVYRWASTTPQDASVVSGQVATLLRVLLLWRKRCHDGSRHMSGVAATTESSRRHSVRSAKAGAPQSDGSGRRGSARSASSRESTVSGLLRRSSVGTMATATSSFLPVADSTLKKPSTSSTATPPRAPLADVLRGCVDALQQELPQSLAVEDKPPIVRALHATFQHQVLSLIEQHARRRAQRQWASSMRGHLHTIAVDSIDRLPLGLGPFQRWIHAALSLDAFVTLLQAERHAREQLDKRWPGLDTPTASFSVTDGFRVQHRMALAALHQPEPEQYETDSGDTRPLGLGPVLVDGAAAFVKMVHTSQMSTPLAEEIARQAQQEPAVAHILTALSGEQMRHYHLQNEHQKMAGMVAELVAKAH